MIKRIGPVDARQQLGRIMDDVSLRMDQYIIERRGKPLVAVIPIQQFEKWLDMRQEFFEAVENIRTANKIISPRKIEKAVAKTVKKSGAGKTRSDSDTGY